MFDVCGIAGGRLEVTSSAIRLRSVSVLGFASSGGSVPRCSNVGLIKSEVKEVNLLPVSLVVIAISHPFFPLVDSLGSSWHKCPILRFTHLAHGRSYSRMSASFTNRLNGRSTKSHVICYCCWASAFVSIRVRSYQSVLQNVCSIYML